MKKTYIQPTIDATVMQHSLIIAASELTNVDITNGPGYGGGNNGSGGVDTKESHSIWDNEW